jgi:hypothetical protein
VIGSFQNIAASASLINYAIASLYHEKDWEAQNFGMTMSGPIRAAGSNHRDCRKRSDASELKNCR